MPPYLEGIRITCLFTKNGISVPLTGFLDVKTATSTSTMIIIKMHSSGVSLLILTLPFQSMLSDNNSLALLQLLQTRFISIKVLSRDTE